MARSAIETHGRRPELLLRLGCMESMLADAEATLAGKERRFADARRLLEESAVGATHDPLAEWNMALLSFREYQAYREAGKPGLAEIKRAEFLSAATEVAWRATQRV